MEKSTARELLATIQESQSFIAKAIAELKGTCPEDMWRAGAKLVGSSMTEMFDYVMGPIFNEHSDLAPDWYSAGIPGHLVDPTLKLPKEAQQALLTAFEAAYEKAQSVAGCLSQLSDPVEVARYSQGFHQISATLCHARVVLLRAEVEEDGLADTKTS